MESFSTGAAVLTCIPINLFWKYTEVLGQRLKSFFWKIMS